VVEDKKIVSHVKLVDWKRQVLLVYFTGTELLQPELLSHVRVLRKPNNHFILCILCKTKASNVKGVVSSLIEAGLRLD
jgi:hypothetical protein